MFNIFVNGKPEFVLSCDATLAGIQSDLHELLNLDVLEYYILQNGKFITDDIAIKQGNIHIVLRTCGGKGGFGSMLRAIGAQIEKTTNREACRDLSGRRLRDINEEKRLKKWITQQSEREKEAADRRQKKLEKLCEKPKHEFKDKDYDNERSQLPEVVESAVSQGLKAAHSNNSSKRKINDDIKPKKKPKLWIDDDLNGLSSSCEEESDDDNNTCSPIIQDLESNSSNAASSDSFVDKNKQISVDIGDCSNDENTTNEENYKQKVHEKSANVATIGT